MDVRGCGEDLPVQTSTDRPGEDQPHQAAAQRTLCSVDAPHFAQRSSPSPPRAPFQRLTAQQQKRCTCKAIILNTKLLDFNTQLLVFDTKFILFTHMFRSSG